MKQNQELPNLEDTGGKLALTMKKIKGKELIDRITGSDVQ